VLSTSGRYRIADAAQAWLDDEHPGEEPLSEYHIAALIDIATTEGIITGGPDGTILSAECCTDWEGGPDCWRVVIHLPALGLGLLSAPHRAGSCPANGIELLQHAADSGNEMLSKAAGAGLLPSA
jgi:hypothetical protein